MRLLKNLVGGLFLFCTVAWVIMAFALKQPPIFVSAVVGGFVSFLLLRKTKKEKAKPSAIKTSSTTAGYVTTASEHEPSAVPEDIAKDMRRYYTLMQAQRDAEIMAESFKLAGSTVTMDVFCMRYDLAMRKAHTLLQAEQVGVKGIKKLNCHDACVAVINAANSLKIRMLTDYEQSAFAQAEGLKTDKGKLNRYIKIKQALTNAEPTFLLMEEYENLVAKVDACITSLGGVVL